MIVLRIGRAWEVARRYKINPGRIVGAYRPKGTRRTVTLRTCDGWRIHCDSVGSYWEKPHGVFPVPRFLQPKHGAWSPRPIQG